MFKVLNLEVNHRQGEYKPYADNDMLNRIIIGKITDEDITKLKTRVRPKNHPHLANVSLNFVPTKLACARYNQEYLDSLKGEEMQIEAWHYHPTQ